MRKQENISKERVKNKQLLPQRLKDSNKQSFENFDLYKKTTEIIDRVNFSTGKKITYTSTQSSTLNYKLNINGYSSTQKI